MQFTVAYKDPSHYIRSIASQLNVRSQSDCAEEILVLPPAYGEGKIMSFAFGDGLSLLIHYAKLKEDWEIILDHEIPPLQVHFGLRGSMRHFMQHPNPTIHYQMMPLQGTITANVANSKESFYQVANEEVIFVKLVIDRAAYLKKVDCQVKQMPEELTSIFKDEKGLISCFYQSDYSLAIGEIIQKIVEDASEGLIRSTFIESKTLELLSKQIQQFQDDILLPEKQTVIRAQDVTKIEDARNILIKDLINPPTIEELAKLAGINRQKLKSGFKKLYEKTINSYLRGERLEQASLQLLAGKNVIESANSVGYTNQSHFSRRFKEKYGVLPKDYLKLIQNNNN